MKKVIGDLLKSLVWGFIAWGICNGLVDLYINSLKASGGIVLATDFIGLGFIPWVIGVMVFYGVFRLYNSE